MNSLAGECLALMIKQLSNSLIDSDEIKSHCGQLDLPALSCYESPELPTIQLVLNK